jgi:hypothetical protein
VKKIFYILGFMALVTVACKEEEPIAPNSPDLCDDTNYTLNDVQVIFENNCVGCHSYGGEGVSAADFSTYEGIVVVIAANPTDFVNRINWTDTDEEYRMPPPEKMAATDIQKLECWIESGYPQ